MAQQNPYPLRVDKAIMDKFRVVAAADGRSVNKAIEMLIKDAVREYERLNGEILDQGQDVCSGQSSR